MLDKKYTKYIFLTFIILNTFIQLFDKPVKFKNWLSIINFIILYILMYVFNEKKKSKK